ncbi:MAG TPA: amidohydrolase family protein [Bacteroidales bacterium]|nr:amidohydrolase family protein [Bacteroidales bacterium]
MISRRDFFRNSAIAAAGLTLTDKVNGLLPAEEKNNFSFDIVKEAARYRKIDAHEHVGLSGTLEYQLGMADRLGINKLVVSKIISADSNSNATPDEVRACNDSVLEVMKKYPDRYLGWCFVNPQYTKESLEEINRCTGEGMIGLKVYNQVKINHPLFYPIIEKMTDLKMIILMHAHCGLGVGGKRTKYGNIQPNSSIPEDFAEAAERYPEALFQYAHTGGGGDWEYACKVLGKYPNVYIDTSGSNNEGGMIDFTVSHFGEDRVFFGTDGSYYQGVGVILSSDLTEKQKHKLFFDNFNEVLRKSGNNIK